jgi:hypothetical protein
MHTRSRLDTVSNKAKQARKHTMSENPLVNMAGMVFPPRGLFTIPWTGIQQSGIILLACDRASSTLAKRFCPN